MSRNPYRTPATPPRRETETPRRSLPHDIDALAAAAGTAALGALVVVLAVSELRCGGTVCPPTGTPPAVFREQLLRCVSDSRSQEDADACRARVELENRRRGAPAPP